jgi:hypothetical protein
MVYIVSHTNNKEWTQKNIKYYYKGTLEWCGVRCGSLLVYVWLKYFGYVCVVCVVCFES